MSTGNYIYIDYDGGFKVGDYYRKDGNRWRRGTWYYTNGTEEEYDEKW